jgi:hypothetical protein
MTLLQTTLKLWGNESPKPLKKPSDVSVDFNTEAWDTFFGDVGEFVFFDCNQAEIIKRLDLLRWNDPSLPRLKKRVDNYVHKNGILLTDYQKAYIQESVERLYEPLPKGDLYGYASDRIWWQSGSFGDGDSCFWRSLQIVREELLGVANFITFTIFSRVKGSPVVWNPELALPQHIKLFDKSSWRGVGRCYLIFDGHFAGNQVYVGNAYGIEGRSMATLIRDNLFPKYKISEYECEPLRWDEDNINYYDNGGFILRPPRSRPLQNFRLKEKR